jgi:lactate/malate dehydrogenase, NAD binding domain
MTKAVVLGAAGTSILDLLFDHCFLSKFKAVLANRCHCSSKEIHSSQMCVHHFILLEDMLNEIIIQLGLFDIVNTPGVAADLSHIATPAKVEGYLPPDGLKKALAGADIVVIPAGVPRKPGVSF